MTVARIVSGGQTGADRGGLEAAIHCGLPYGGWCPKGRKSEDGTIPAKYILQEMNTPDYLARTEANVVDSDATLIFTAGRLEGGSLKTSQFAVNYSKPCLHIDTSAVRRGEAVVQIVDWLARVCPRDCVLNVAGSRASKAPQLAGTVRAWLVDVLSAVNGKLFVSISENPVDNRPATEYSPVDYKDMRVRLEATGQEEQLYHPASIAEAVETVLQAISTEAKRLLQSVPKDELLAHTHFGLGVAIRNCMICRNVNQLDLMADFQAGCRAGKWQGEAAPDPVSAVIVGLVWDALHDTIP